MWYTYTMEYYSGIKKNEILPLAAKWKGLENTIFSEVSQRQILYNITYMWNIKNNTNEFICKRETDSQIQKRNVWFDLCSFSYYIKLSNN